MLQQFLEKVQNKIESNQVKLLITSIKVKKNTLYKSVLIVIINKFKNSLPIHTCCRFEYYFEHIISLSTYIRRLTFYIYMNI